MDNETILKQILDQQTEILKLLKKPTKEATRFIKISDIMADLNISRSVFERLKADMPFLRRLGYNRDYRARLSDYEKWKKQYFNL